MVKNNFKTEKSFIIYVKKNQCIFSVLSEIEVKDTKG